MRLKVQTSIYLIGQTFILTYLDILLDFNTHNLKCILEKCLCWIISKEVVVSAYRSMLARVEKETKWGRGKENIRKSHNVTLKTTRFALA